MLIPRSLLFGGILVLASVGAYSLNRSLLDLVLLYIVGAVGWARFGISSSSARTSAKRGTQGED